MTVKEKAFFCPKCGELLIQTGSGYWTCFNGCLRLMRERDVSGWLLSPVEREARENRRREDVARREALKRLPLCGIEHDLGAVARSLWWVQDRDGYFAWIGKGQLETGDGVHAIRATNEGRRGRLVVVTLRPLAKEEVIKRLFGKTP